MFSGAVLTGGQSRRMGTDKALLEVNGVAMAARVALALRTAGASEVVAVGGDAARLAALGLQTIPDVAPGAGPLGGIISALRASTADVVVISACDMPWLQSEHVTALVAAIDEETDIAVSTAEGRVQPLHSAWHARVLEQLEAAFAAGERSPTRVLNRCATTLVELGDGPWARDLDEPADLADTR